MAECTWHLAQINIGKMLAAKGDPVVADFFAALDRINALADASPGFVWRLQDDGGDATGISYSDDPLLLVNMSVWMDADALFGFVYRSAHTPEMARRKEFFERFDGHYQALWWIPAGTIPTVNDGLSRLWLLDRMGPSRHAFTFKSQFPNPDAEMDSPPRDMQPDPWCSGRA